MFDAVSRLLICQRGFTLKFCYCENLGEFQGLEVVGVHLKMEMVFVIAEIFALINS